MHQEDDNYDDDHDYDDNIQDKYKHYFKFDPEAWDTWGKWLYSALNDIISSNKSNFPVKDNLPDIGKYDKYYLYLGSNLYKEPVWKAKYFVSDKYQILWLNHIQNHVVYFLKQPSYYKGLFDILN